MRFYVGLVSFVTMFLVVVVGISAVLAYWSAQHNCQSAWAESGYEYKVTGVTCKVSLDGGHTFLPSSRIKVDL
jgi:hypothetical protein